MSGLYLHIPFCLSKCPYCDFYSCQPQPGEIDRYVDALCDDMAQSKAWFSAGPFETVFFGGGTPSLLSATQVGRLLDVAARYYGLAADAEISLEANPGTVDLEQLSGYRAAGVNRLSFGVQSFDDRQLAWLGRRHDRREAVAAIEFARHAGFDRLSIDLMFALPQQGDDDLRNACRWLQRLAPQHVSVYGLTIEEGTPLAVQDAAGELLLPDEERYRQQFLLLNQQLAALGYGHYEISNYAQPDEQCRHNVGYWQRQPYLGVGAGAHSFVDHGWGERWSCENSIASYQQAVANGQSPRHKIEDFTCSEAMAEMAYLALRCQHGIDERDFVARFDRDFSDQFRAAISQCAPHLSCTAGRWHFDLEGWLLYNYYIEKFLRC